MRTWNIFTLKWKRKQDVRRQFYFSSHFHWYSTVWCHCCQFSTISYRQCLFDVQIKTFPCIHISLFLVAIMKPTSCISVIGAAGRRIFWMGYFHIWQPSRACVHLFGVCRPWWRKYMKLRTCNVRRWMWEVQSTPPAQLIILSIDADFKSNKGELIKSVHIWLYWATHPPAHLI